MEKQTAMDGKYTAIDSIPAPVSQVRRNSPQRKSWVKLGAVAFLACVLFTWSKSPSLEVIQENHDALQAYMQHIESGRHKVCLWGKKAEKLFLYAYLGSDVVLGTDPCLRDQFHRPRVL